MCRGAGAPETVPNRRLRVRQVQPRQPFIGKYVPGWAEQLGIIERTDMRIFVDSANVVILTGGLNDQSHLIPPI